MRRDTPVVIAGASFAGLAVARELGPRALLLDGDPVGEGQTSACGAPVRVLRAVEAGASIQEVHHDLVIHTPGRDVRWPLPEPFCTFDYRTCCRAAFEASGAAFLRAAVYGHRDGTVALTSAGEIRARLLVDATGWRAALSRTPGSDSRLPAAVTRGPAGGRYFGLEVEVPATFETGLHFYFSSDIVRGGYAWVFPAGRVVRAGILSYRARSGLGPQLEAFLGRLGLPSGPRHGGFLPTRLGPPVVDGVFLVGDAAGHCLPLTGEGIRSAVWAGRVCGRLLRGVLAEEMTPAGAAAGYAAYAERQRRRYRVLEWSTAVALTFPARVLGVLAAGVSRPGPLRAFMARYLAMFAADVGAEAALPA
ncbi:MAG TPA: NAD(P)/FAD-dependent oxidoreductase [bacterium]|nr:NAD(P)/FAD-dependent oxidoreductase [bacterium]